MRFPSSALVIADRQTRSACSYWSKSIRSSFAGSCLGRPCRTRPCRLPAIHAEIDTVGIHTLTQSPSPKIAFIDRRDDFRYPQDLQRTGTLLLIHSFFPLEHDGKDFIIIATFIGKSFAEMSRNDFSKMFAMKDEVTFPNVTVGLQDAAEQAIKEWISNTFLSSASLA